MAATLTGSSTLEAREGAQDASDSEREAGRGSAARAVRSSISSGLERGEGVHISGSGLELEPMPLKKRLAGPHSDPIESMGSHILWHLQQKAVVQQVKAT